MSAIVFGKLDAPILANAVRATVTDFACFTREYHAIFCNFSDALIMRINDEIKSRKERYIMSHEKTV